MFIDDPPGDSPLGIYAVTTNGDAPSLTSTSIAGEDLSPEDKPPDAGLPPGSVTALAGVPFQLPAEADNIHLSPDSRSIAWTVGSDLPVNVDRRQRTLWVVSAPGERRLIGLLTGGDLVGWTEDGKAVVATGGVAADGVVGIWRIPIDGTPPTLLADADRPRGARLSLAGRWLVYYLAFEDEPERNGLWFVGTDGAAARRIVSFGSYRWGGDERLYLIPFDPEGIDLALEAFDPATGDVKTLLRDAFPGGIAGNDWNVSPDGQWASYRSAVDDALWIVPLPGG